MLLMLNVWNLLKFIFNEFLVAGPGLFEEFDLTQRSCYFGSG